MENAKNNCSTIGKRVQRRAEVAGRRIESSSVENRRGHRSRRSFGTWLVVADDFSPARISKEASVVGHLNYYSRNSVKVITIGAVVVLVLGWWLLMISRLLEYRKRPAL